MGYGLIKILQRHGIGGGVRNWAVIPVGLLLLVSKSARCRLTCAQSTRCDATTKAD